MDDKKRSNDELVDEILQEAQAFFETALQHTERKLPVSL